ncbi:hypothetical protein EF847_10075 [Actinobacteria bacterium YIM 96077]|uniref:Uncharacterized protein n=1 Tax=Phytoactinopolyspora halophila TaxID=1981511 RepID=A0A329QMV8_9ACTN|nr:hypothetical protein [Phytoactinopolyspora halophila]AYY12997.1 hypothetical protein EF847_10075 [Actinobacteria bacterium YIM 96077]RAW13261.1 hypothetical protein DPM12_13100 [Phytoactinopolyspora halophila]
MSTHTVPDPVHDPVDTDASAGGHASDLESTATQAKPAVVLARHGDPSLRHAVNRNKHSTWARQLADLRWVRASEVLHRTDDVVASRAVRAHFKLNVLARRSARAAARLAKLRRERAASLGPAELVDQSSDAPAVERSTPTL